jgi:hypothetical protein
MNSKAFSYLLTQPDGWVQSRRGALSDIRYTLASDFTALFLRQCKQIYII